MKYSLIDFNIMEDERGNLIALEENKNVPFAIKRVYYIYNNDTNTRRGMHAHKELKQLIACLNGSCKFLLDDGKETCEILLNKPHKGLLIEGFCWREIFTFSNDCILLVLANQHYKEEEYIRDYETFLKIVENKEKSC